jgi:hypothetical protein
MLEPKDPASRFVEPTAERVIGDDLARRIVRSRDGADRVVERVALDLPPARRTPQVQHPPPPARSVAAMLRSVAHVGSHTAVAGCLPERASNKHVGVAPSRHRRFVRPTRGIRLSIRRSSDGTTCQNRRNHDPID